MSHSPRLLALVPALGIVAWATGAIAQPANPELGRVPADRPASSQTAATAPSASGTDVDPPLPHPTFVVGTLSGEAGGYYAAGAKVAALATPFSGVSLGGSAFFAPITSVKDSCAATCNLNPLLFRWMAELRVGNPYTDYSRSLAWFGLSAGVEYLSEPGIAPSPSAALAGGGDLRLTNSLWLELALRLTWAQLIGPSSPFAGAYFTFGVEVGLRFDFAH